MTTVIPTVLRLPENILGRDFIVGDLHGAVALLEDAMDKAGFDEERDRLFLVGDLIDRGLESALCVEILKKPYAHSLRGNHEDMLIEIYADGPPDPAVLKYLAGRNGFAWWLDTPEDLRQEILTALRALPLVIEIQTARGTVGMVHAEVPHGMDWATFLEKIESGDKATTKLCLWGYGEGEGRRRNRHQAETHGAVNDRDGVPGVGRLFVGHNVHFDGIAQYANVYAIDCGAVFGASGRRPEGKLAMVNAAMGTMIMMAPRDEPEPGEVTLIDLRDDARVPEAPFGDYATRVAEASPRRGPR